MTQNRTIISLLFVLLCAATAQGMKSDTPVAREDRESFESKTEEKVTKELFNAISTRNIKQINTMLDNPQVLINAVMFADVDSPYVVLRYNALNYLMGLTCFSCSDKDLLYTEIIGRKLIKKGARIFTETSTNVWMSNAPKEAIALLAKLYKEEKGINFFTLQSPSGETYLQDYFFKRWSRSQTIAKYLKCFLPLGAYQGLWIKNKEGISVFTKLVNSLEKCGIYGQTLGNKIYSRYGDASYLFSHEFLKRLLDEKVKIDITKNEDFITLEKFLNLKDASVDIKDDMGNTLSLACLQKALNDITLQNIENLLSRPSLQAEADYSSALLTMLMKYNPDLSLLNQQGKSAYSVCCTTIKRLDNKHAKKLPLIAQILAPVLKKVDKNISTFWRHLLLCQLACRIETTPTKLVNLWEDKKSVQHLITQMKIAPKVPKPTVPQYTVTNAAASNLGALPPEVFFYISAIANQLIFDSPEFETTPTLIRKLRAQRTKLEQLQNSADKK
jgi:hypothetical protein